MTKQTMSIHRALTELKLLDSKINKKISAFVPVGAKQEGKLVDNAFREEDFIKDTTAGYQSIIDLIERKTALKKAIMTSNAITTVVVAGKTMTVVEAINYKDNIQYKRMLVTNLVSKVNRTVGRITTENEKVEAKADRNIEIMLGTDTKHSDTEVKALTEPFIKRNSYELVDPLEILKKLDVLQNEVDNFEAEVDAILSESNAVTTIDI
jgi:hypothetical protein